MVFVKLYAIAALDAPVVAVFRRARKRTILYRWDLARGKLEVGAAIDGKIYPRRCDISPDGELLYYFAFMQTSEEFLGGTSTFSAVSKLPWLYALAAWREDGTWTRGCHFVGAVPGTADLGEPGHGDDVPLRRKYSLVRNRPLQYGVELRRGWVEHEDCPPRGPNDAWDEARKVVLMKSRPQGKGRLVLSDRGYQPEMGVDGRAPAYKLELPHRTVELADVTWADWDPTGRLLTATADGRLQILDAASAELRVIHEHSVAELEPIRAPAPAWAQRW